MAGAADMPRLHLDFETRGTVDLTKVGVYVYANHPRTEVLLARYAIDDGPIHGWRKGEPIPPLLRDALEDPETVLVAHNAMFEWHMIEYNLAVYNDWPTKPIEQLDCTAARAAIQSLPRALAGAAKASGINVEKDDEGRRLMLQMCKPRKPRKGEDPDGIYWFEDQQRMDRLDLYCQKDVEVERELDQVLQPMSAREKKIWLLDFKINVRGVAVDLDLVYEADKVLSRALRELSRELAVLTDGAVTTVNQLDRLKNWVVDNAGGVDEIESLDKQALTELLERDDLTPTVRRVLEIRRQAAKSSTAKLKAFKQRTSPDGRMRENLLYHGAGTGRWSGRGVQLQNLPRPELSQKQIEHAISVIKDNRMTVEKRVELLDFLYGGVPTVISDCLRGCVVGGPSGELVVADYSNIEGRANAWAAGQDDKVALFADGGKVYERMAAAIYAIEDETTITKDSHERHLGKTAELGCGYQMGWKKFLKTCWDAGIKIDEELAQHTVDTFRRVNNKIKQLWYELEEAAVEAMRLPGTLTDYNNISFYQTPDRSFLLMILPSGRKLYYAQPELRKTTTPWGAEKDQITYMGQNSYTNRWERLSTYGGKLTENAIQAIARDLMAFSMYRAEQHGFPIVLTVHDELVAEITACQDDAERKKELDTLRRIMCELPKWAQGLPVAAEGYVGWRFRK